MRRLLANPPTKLAAERQREAPYRVDRRSIGADLALTQSVKLDRVSGIDKGQPVGGNLVALGDVECFGKHRSLRVNAWLLLNADRRIEREHESLTPSRLLHHPQVGSPEQSSGTLARAFVADSLTVVLPVKQQGLGLLLLDQDDHHL